MFFNFKSHTWRGKETTFKGIIQLFKEVCNFGIYKRSLPKHSCCDHLGQGGGWRAEGKMLCSSLLLQHWIPIFTSSVQPTTLCSDSALTLFIPTSCSTKTTSLQTIEILLAINLDFELQWMKLSKKKKKKNDVRTPCPPHCPWKKSHSILCHHYLWTQTPLEITPLPCLQRLGIYMCWRFTVLAYKMDLKSFPTNVCQNLSTHSYECSTSCFRDIKRKATVFLYTLPTEHFWHQICGFFPTPTNSPTSVAYLTIHFNSDIIYLTKNDPQNS